MSVIQSTQPLPYDKIDPSKLAIIQIETSPLLKDLVNRRYIIEVNYYRLTDDEFQTRILIGKRPQPYYFSFDEVDNFRSQFKEGAQLTSDEEEQLIEQLHLQITINDPNPAFNNLDWAIIPYNQ